MFTIMKTIANSFNQPFPQLKNDLCKRSFIGRGGQFGQKESGKPNSFRVIFMFYIQINQFLLFFHGSE